MAVNRMSEQDIALVDKALGAMDLAQASLQEIDLRKYGGDAEVRQNVRDAKQVLADGKKALRHARSLKWRR